MVSFREFLVFFGAVFCTEKFKMICRMVVDMFFQNGLISQIVAVF